MDERNAQVATTMNDAGSELASGEGSAVDPARSLAKVCTAMQSRGVDVSEGCHSLICPNVKVDITLPQNSHIAYRHSPTWPFSQHPRKFENCFSIQKQAELDNDRQMACLSRQPFWSTLAAYSTPPESLIWLLLSMG